MVSGFQSLLLIVAILAMPAGVLAWIRWRRRRIARNWARVEAEVVEKVDSNTEGMGLYPRVAYEFGGQRYRSLAMDWYSAGLIAPIGTKVDLLVDPDNPARCVVYSDQHFRKDGLTD